MPAPGCLQPFLTGKPSALPRSYSSPDGRLIQETVQPQHPFHHRLRGLQTGRNAVIGEANLTWGRSGPAEMAVFTPHQIEQGEAATPLHAVAKLLATPATNIVLAARGHFGRRRMARVGIMRPNRTIWLPIHAVAEKVGKPDFHTTHTGNPRPKTLPCRKTD